MENPVAGCKKKIKSFRRFTFRLESEPEAPCKAVVTNTMEIFADRYAPRRRYSVIIHQLYLSRAPKFMVQVHGTPEYRYGHT